MSSSPSRAPPLDRDGLTVSDEKKARDALARSRRVIVKVGSKSLAGDAWQRLAAEVRAMRDAKRDVVIVSSGAIALGIHRLGLKHRPKDMAWLQAAAAAGQSTLMQRWEAAFEPLGIAAAQVLLTHADLADRARTNNARSALSALLEAGAVPVVNENDAVAVDEIKFGDNDQLASMVVPLVGADLLLLLSDVEGLLDDGGRRVPFVRSVAKEARPFAQGSRSGVGTGGMTSKIEAARRATLAGANVVIAPAREPGIIGRVLAAEDVGTLFPGVHRRLAARKHWIAFTLRPRGALVLDPGAAQAVQKNRSVLAVGVLGVRGSFQPDDSVALYDIEGREIARGLVQLSAVDAARVCGKRDEKGESPELVHKDDLVVLTDE
ncbi:MAG: glutamate 5-kinase [Polyangiaceae bacterium]|nr:glutamate 5-kinase [Polyangiaceae bacterium]